MIELQPGALESLLVPWRLVNAGELVDPLEPPGTTAEYALAALEAPAPGAADPAWEAGAWEAGGPQVVDLEGRPQYAHMSRTPTLGAAGAGATIEAAAGEWVLWGRLLDEPERLPRRIGTIRLR